MEFNWILFWLLLNLNDNFDEIIDKTLKQSHDDLLNDYLI